jgi:hypothetical protein
MTSEASGGLILRPDIAEQGDQMAILNTIRLWSDSYRLPDA